MNDHEFAFIDTSSRRDGGGANPARSTAAALYQGAWALKELWGFRVLPLAGAALAGLAQHWFTEK